MTSTATQSNRFTPPNDLSHIRALAMVFVLAFSIRALVLVLTPAAFSDDPDGYRSIAVHWRATGEYAWPNAGVAPYPTAFRPPLYPLLLALLATDQTLPLWRVAFTHALLGAFTTSLTFALARRLGLTTGAWLAAGWVLFDPILLAQSQLFMSETLAAVLAIGVLYCHTRWRASCHSNWLLAAGFLSGLAVLCRPVFLVWAILNLLWLVWTQRSVAKRKFILLYMLPILLCLSPWWMRNYVALQRPVLTTSHGGYTLLLGNNPDFYEYLENGSEHIAWSRRPNDFIDQHTVPACCSSSELKQDRQYAKLAWEMIRQQPRSFLLACAYRQWQLWSPLPQRVDINESASRRWLRYAVALWYSIQYGAILLALWQWQRKINVVALPWLLTLIFAVAAVHTLYWTNLRMRAPLIPGLAIVAGCCCPPRKEKAHSEFASAEMRS
jgi:4-amino-4-deoxy-L-arabinose transferase-like glycosyltransferase